MTLKRSEVDILAIALAAYEGPHLHLCLEDGNWDRESLEVSAQSALEASDFFAYAIARTFLKLPDEGLKEIGVMGHKDALWLFLNEDLPYIDKSS